MSDFRVGEIYFYLFYRDENMLYPFFENWVYLGENIDFLIDGLGDDERRWCFQDAVSYLEYGSCLECNESQIMRKHYKVNLFEENAVTGLYDYTSMLDELERCLSRRIRKGL